MYRSPANPEAVAVVARAELAYPTGNARSRAPAIAILQLVSLPLLVAIVLQVVVGPTAGLVGLLGSIGFGLWTWRRGKSDAVVFHVDGPRLRVGPARRPLYDGALDDVLDVALDTKQIEMVQEGGSAIPAVRFIESQVGPKLDRARLELVVRGRPSVTLTKEFGPHMEASEWAGKVRVFLRKHGWVPADEREDESPPSSET